ncbi:hypothetical protein JZ751_028114 [Albula glossodonta]|uniref:Serine/arginine repetitive matrix protein 2-like n=1 Tax=Albula glossodonta TaxID=121402 RepID=A0A8T2PD51_9TELE|nr:hypothetical protein JZ751_028114 [Albula glossodonta]
MHWKTIHCGEGMSWVWTSLIPLELTSEGHLVDRVPCSVENKGPGEKVTDGTKSEGETPYQVMNCPKNSQLAKVPENTNPVKGTASKDEVETPRKKSKKHKRHKSKKKKKKRKEEKGSSSESELESDGETQNQSSAKNEVAANKEGRGIDQGNPGAGKESSRTLLIDPSGQEGERRAKKEKRHANKKKKKKMRRREEKRSPAHSGSTSVSGTESDTESKPMSRLLLSVSPVISSDMVREKGSSSPCPDAKTVITLPSMDAGPVKCKSVGAEDSGKGKYALTVENLGAEHKSNQGTTSKAQDLPDIIPKHESTHIEGSAKEDLKKLVREGGERCRSSSRSLYRSQSVSKRETSCHIPVKKSHSRSLSPDKLTGKYGSQKAHSTSQRRSRSSSRKNSPNRKHSRSHSGRQKSRSLSVRRSIYKPRSLSSKRRRRSKSRNKRSKSRSKSLSRHNRSRSKSRSSQYHHSQSSRRNRQSRSRSQSRHRRSRSIRRRRRTRSRSIVILRRSRSRRNRRSTSLRCRRSRSRSPWKSRRSKSRSTRPKNSKSRTRRRSRSKSGSLTHRKHSQSRSPEKCHQSKAKSPKRGIKRSRSPKRRNLSKSSSPSRNESRSISRDGQSSENISSPTKAEVGPKSASLSKSQHHASLTSPEKKVQRVSPEKKNYVDVTFKEICCHSGNTSEQSLKADTPFDPTSNETSAQCLEHSTDSSEKGVSIMGSWKPVPPLVDGKMRHKYSPVHEAVSSATAKVQVEVAMPCENAFPLNSKEDMSFMTEMPLISSEISEHTTPYITSGATQSELISELVCEDGGKHQSRSVSPQCYQLSEPLKNLEESIRIALMEKKTEMDRSSPHDCRSSESRYDGYHSRSHSPSTKEKPPGEKDKNHKSSKQRQSSKSPGQKKHSKSRSPTRNKKSKSESPASRKRSRSNSSSYRNASQSKSSTRKKSKSPTKKRKSRSVSRSRKKRSKSKSPSRRRWSRSKSAARKRKSHSRSRNRTKRSQSRSPKRNRSKSRSPNKKKQSKSRSPARRRRSKSADKSKHSKSRSPGRRKRSQSRARRSRSKRSHSSPRRRRSGFPLDRRDRWKRTPSHSPVLILRKRRSTSRPHRSSSKTPPRLTELDKDQLLEIAKANAAAMCAKAGVPVPESLRPKAILQLPLPSPVPTSSSLPLPLPINLPVNLPMGMANMPNMAMNAALATMSAALSTMSALTAMPALPTITNKPPPAAVPNAANIEEVKRKVAQKANSISIKELTEKCKKIAESKEEMAIAKPHVSDDEDDEKPFAGAGLKENKGITFSLSVRLPPPNFP